MNYSALFKRIEEVFPDYPPPAFTLYDGQRADDYGHGTYPHEVEGRVLRWHELRMVDLKETCDALGYLEKEGQHYYLPAYLRHALISWETGTDLAWALERGIDTALKGMDDEEFVTHFTSEQIDFIIDFLKVVIVEMAGDQFHAEAFHAIFKWEAVRDKIGQSTN